MVTSCAPNRGEPDGEVDRKSHPVRDVKVQVEPPREESGGKGKSRERRYHCRQPI